MKVDVKEKIPSKKELLTDPNDSSRVLIHTFEMGKNITTEDLRNYVYRPCIKCAYRDKATDKLIIKDEHCNHCKHSAADYFIEDENEKNHS